MWVRIHLILYIEAAPRNPGPIKIIKLPGVEVGPHGIFGRLRGIQPWMSRMAELNGDWTGLPRFFLEVFCKLPSTVRVYWWFFRKTTAGETQPEKLGPKFQIVDILCYNRKGHNSPSVRLGSWNVGIIGRQQPVVPVRYFCGFLSTVNCAVFGYDWFISFISPI